MSWTLKAASLRTVPPRCPTSCVPCILSPGHQKGLGWRGSGPPAWPRPLCPTQDQHFPRAAQQITVEVDLGSQVQGALGEPSGHFYSFKTLQSGAPEWGEMALLIQVKTALRVTFPPLLPPNPSSARPPSPLHPLSLELIILPSAPKNLKPRRQKPLPWLLLALGIQTDLRIGLHLCQKPGLSLLPPVMGCSLSSAHWLPRRSLHPFPECQLSCPAHPAQSCP